MKPIASVFSPAWPAAILLYGMVFAFAAVHFAAVAWSRSMSVALYAVLLVWVSALAWRERRRLWPATTLDLLFAGFALWVVGSLVFQGGLQGGGGQYARYLPFMVMAPYLCGRLMRTGDMALFSRIVLVAGVGILPLLLIDRMISPDLLETRRTFFGQNHAALLIGALLAVALLALCARGAAPVGSDCDFKSRLIHYGLIGLMSGFLVWVSARGWLIVAIAGLGVLVLSAYRDKVLRGVYLRQLVFVVAVVSLALAVLPRPASQFYANLLTGPTQAAGQIFGEESCRPLKEGVNSVAIRWVLYREAMVLAAESPVLGVGAGRFGERSCTGPSGFPHSTMLQGFAELGLAGGGLLLGMLLFAGLTLTRRVVFATNRPNESAGSFVLALFAAFIAADQLYGNYFMSSGMCLMLGVAAGTLADEKRGRVAHV